LPVGNSACFLSVSPPRPLFGSNLQRSIGSLQHEQMEKRNKESKAKSAALLDSNLNRQMHEITQRKMHLSAEVSKQKNIYIMKAVHK
jgi:hypothetical protein